MLLLQTSTNAHRYWSLAAQDSAASTQWAPTPVRGTHWSAVVVTMLTRRALHVWVRLEPPCIHTASPSTSLCPRGPVEGPSGPQGVLLACPTDVNECETGVHRCGEGQLCHNLPGSYRCDCKPGFQRDAFGRTCIGKGYWGLGSPGHKEPAPLCQLSGLDLPRWLSSSYPLSSWLRFHAVARLLPCPPDPLHPLVHSLLAAHSVPTVRCLPCRCERMLGLAGPPVPAHM